MDLYLKNWLLIKVLKINSQNLIKVISKHILSSNNQQFLSTYFYPKTLFTYLQIRVYLFKKLVYHE